MNSLIGFLRELRLMKDQPSHRFYAVWLLIFLILSFIGRGFVLIVLILGGGLVIKPALVMGLLSRFF